MDVTGSDSITGRCPGGGGHHLCGVPTPHPQLTHWLFGSFGVIASKDEKPDPDVCCSENNKCKLLLSAQIVILVNWPDGNIVPVKIMLL